MMKRMILSFAFAAGLISGIYAAGPTLTINGVEVAKTVTKITFDGDNAVLHFGDDTESHDMNSVMLTFSSLSGIDELIAYSFNGIINDNIELGGIPAGTTIEIYDTIGKLLVSEKSVSDPTCINISLLKSGVYLLRAGKNCIKFKK